MPSSAGESDAMGPELERQSHVLGLVETFVGAGGSWFQVLESVVNADRGEQ